MTERCLNLVPPASITAILAGELTEIRRPVRLPHGYEPGEVSHFERCGERWALYCDPGPNILIDCHLGRPGDRLWVQETWQVVTGRQAGDLGAAIRYKDMELRTCWMPKDKAFPLGLTWDRWRPTTCMPRWAARLVLEIESVRAERLVDKQSGSVYGWDWVVKFARVG